MTNYQWNCRTLTNQQKEIKDELVAENKLNPIVAHLLAQRGVTNSEEAHTFFRPQLGPGLHDPFLMKDMDKAVARLNEAIGRKEHILIYGDYDVDGTSSVALVYKFLRSFYSSIDYYIPDRYDDGYGISEKGIDYAFSEGTKLIIALDCGIKANDMVAYAKSKGIDFIICDHHKPDDVLPEAVAVLDSKRLDDDYPYPHLSACGVGFKLMQAFARDNGMNELGMLYPLLDLCAISIATDIVPITGENRVLSYYGLRRLNDNPCPGIKAIIKQCGLVGKELTNSDIVFKIGPRINAAGRMMCGKEAVDLLTARDEQTADAVAARIAEYNDSRKDLDKRVTEEAFQMVDAMDISDKHSILVYNPSWHKGVIGIVASRLTEHYYRPAVVLTTACGFASGSARSVQGFDVYSAIDSCRDLIENFGGHTYAAGLTLKESNIPELTRRLEQWVDDHITLAQQRQHLDIDMEVKFREVTPRLYRNLKPMAPFGPGNNKPLFVARRIKDQGNSRLVGRNNEHIRMEMVDPETGFTHNGIAFNMADKFDIVKSGKPFDVVFTIEENTYNSNSIQLLVKDIKLNENNTIASVLAQLIRSKDDSVEIDQGLGEVNE
ncbi:MAG: single-stranded-DNA-specific exonuclease RecJ [Bacteroidales bacterium]|nr:single-stranded-DNA-specific exonuclease RecJ [Bacteroidales bacterium]MBP5214266.1 single-stranded-DNA-specific exonuclease RecJ [Bacteroidales bacterium]MBP5764699.1 single-stranded-DNA-specific exonuclease RecJ [Bacteroidales bacterium]